MKKQYVILVVAVILLSGYLMIRNTDRFNYELPALPHLSKKDITAIEIQTKDHGLLLKKDGRIWRIGPEKYLAAEDRVNEMLEAIGTLTLTAMVSQSRYFDRFDLTDQKKISIKAFSGKKVKRTFDLGSVAGTRQHTFVRIAGDDRVYHARGDLKSRFAINIDDIRDKTVMMFNPREIREIRLGFGKELQTITRVQVPEAQAGDVPVGEEGAAADKSGSRKNEVIWQRTDGQPADDAALERLLSSVSELKSQRYIYDRKKDDFKDPRYSITFIGARPYSLSFFGKEKDKPDEIPVVSSENGSPFVLDQWKAEEIASGIETMIKPQKKE